ncbi:DUF2269 family protein [Pseudomonas sp. McL0111]|uniref:DUF2269 family protein n=1 Tax=Pseudomonas sp. McL0111 TaxID=3457357 RepID=UPI00403EBDAC
MLYLSLKYIHIIAAIFLFGFGMGSYLYLIAASRTGNPQVIAHVAKMVIRFDTWITTPAGFIQILSGGLMVKVADMPMTTDWVMTSLIIYLCIGTIWLPVLRLQTRLHALSSAAAASGQGLDDEYRSVYLKWFWMGVVGFSGMFVIVLVMVMKMTPWQMFQLLF